MIGVLLVRKASAALLLPLLAFYIWFTFRSDGALMTVPGVPKLIWSYFDHHTNQRNAVGFLVLGSLVSMAVYKKVGRWRVIALAACVVAPIAKDCAQIGLATRHYNTAATLLGVVGALVGFGLGQLVAAYLTSERSGISGHASE